MTPVQIIAFNSSPRDNRTSKTELVLQAFLNGARRGGAAAETLYLRQYRINHCLGDFGCWFKTPGRCVQQDDMSRLLFPHLLEADLAVLATPLYHYNMNACMKAFIERTLPLVPPPGEDAGDGSPQSRLPRVAALSVCAFPDQATFQALSLNMRLIFGERLVAEIYRHSSEALAAPPLAAKVQEVLAAATRAGEELVQQGRINPGTLEALTQDLAPREELMRLGGEFFRREREKYVQDRPH
jgi:multimeric flavodoxin WrbA